APGKNRIRAVEPEATMYTATPPAVPPKDGETGGKPLDENVVVAETPVRTGFNATAVIDGNGPTAATRIGEIDNEADLDAVLAAEKAKGNRTGVLEAIEARRAVLMKGDD